jgi:hypothetical protein
MQEFEATGYWFLPDNPSREIPGTLRFSPSDGLTLSLSGTLSSYGTLAEAWHSSGSQKYAIIHGVTNESPYGRMFTLVDGFRSGVTLHTPGFTTEAIHANSAYAGDHLLQEADLRFDEFRVGFTDLAKWIRLTGIQTQWPEETTGVRRFRVEYGEPDQICLTFAGKPLTLGFQWTMSSSVRSVTVREDVAFRMSGLEQLTIQEIRRQYLQPLHDFFSFAADYPNAIDEFVVFNGRIRLQQSDRPSAIRVLGQLVYLRAGEEKPRDADDMLFTYDDVSEFVGELLNRWNLFRGTFEPFCRVYFSSQYAPGQFVEERFLAVVRALILIFRQTMPECPHVPGALKDVMDSVRKTAIARDSQWLTDVMPLEAELCFPWHLSEVLTKYQDLLGPLIGNDIERFVSPVVATRRYVSCPEPSQRSGALRGSDLHWTTEKLNALIKVCILDWLEFPRDLISKLLNRNARYQHLKSVP